jgi:hypothetical protein
MVELESPRWRDLRHAYGPATNVAPLLARLAGGERSDELEQSLYGMLWHQGDVFTASYAAVPHIMQAAARMPAGERLKWLVLAVGIVATSEVSRAPVVPDDLGTDLRHAVTTAEGLVRDTLFASSWKKFEVRYWLGIVAVLQGAPEAGLALFDVDAGMTCDSCGSDMDVSQKLHLKT